MKLYFTIVKQPPDDFSFSSVFAALDLAVVFVGETAGVFEGGVFEGVFLWVVFPLGVFELDCFKALFLTFVSEVFLGVTLLTGAAAAVAEEAVAAEVTSEGYKVLIANFGATSDVLPTPPTSAAAGTSNEEVKKEKSLPGSRKELKPAPVSGLLLFPRS